MDLKKDYKCFNASFQGIPVVPPNLDGEYFIIISVMIDFSQFSKITFLYLNLNFNSRLIGSDVPITFGVFVLYSFKF